MRIVAISDVHEKWKKLQIPECDVLISCGDYSFRGEKHVVKEFHEWLNKQEASHIVSVQGNHELWVEKNFEGAKKIATEACPAVHFIDEGAFEIEGVKFYASAVTPYFHNWAWNVLRGDPISRHWAKIPDDTEILITHGPPYGILDKVDHSGRFDYDPSKDRQTGKRVGCEELYKRIWQLPKLRHHFFGHIHEEHGHFELNDRHFWNCSICDDQYFASNEPTIVEYEK